MHFDSFTIVTSARKFLPPFDDIQRRTFDSWMACKIPVVASADQAGVAPELGCYPNVAVFQGIRSGRSLGYTTGACLVNDLLIKALPMVHTPMVLFMGSDMVAGVDFVDTVDGVLAERGLSVFLDCGHNAFLSSKFWFRKMALEMPDFIIGRPYWADWVRSWARKNVGSAFGPATLPLSHCEHDGRLVFLEEHAWGIKAPSVAHNMSLMTSRFDVD